MATIDLSSYNLTDLRALQLEIANEIKDRQQQELVDAREQILTIAQNLGMSVEDLLATNVGKPRGNVGNKVQPQYENPADKSQTWSGRGRQPRWVTEELDGGKTLEDLKINR